VVSHCFPKVLIPELASGSSHCLGLSLKSNVSFGKRLHLPVQMEADLSRPRANEKRPRNVTGQDVWMLPKGLRGDKTLHPFPV
jgi:hypothetical protein